MTVKKATQKPAARATPRKAKKTVRRKTPAESDRLGAQIRAVLVEVMSASESDSVRVAAAKALLDRLKKSEPNEDDGEERGEDGGREAAIAEARALLAEIADAKSGGARGSRPVA